MSSLSLPKTFTNTNSYAPPKSNRPNQPTTLINLNTHQAYTPPKKHPFLSMKSMTIFPCPFPSLA